MTTARHARWCVVIGDGAQPTAVWWTRYDGRPFDETTARRAADEHNLFVQTLGPAVALPLTHSPK